MPDRNSTMVMNGPVPTKREGELDEAVLVLLYPPGPNLGRKYSMTAHELVVGRMNELDIAIETDSVSRRHARLFRDEGRWKVEDLGSTNGTYVNDRKIEHPIALRNGDLVRFGGAIAKFLAGQDIEASYHEEIYKMSIVDGLTGVHNKRFFLEFLEREISGAARYRMPLALVLFDIDHFKKVNDTHGHLAGDTVLKELARRLKPRIRREDLLARYGGEEFACILTKTPLEGAVHFAESLREMVARLPFQYEGTALPVTISLGLAVFQDTTPCPPSDLIRTADEKLYEAKRTGRNRVIS
jgi:two-component system, cell cycle response regulator